ncbi:MAG: outer membrane beta-barrel domain-containing protein [Myxococcales bacterium]
MRRSPAAGSIPGALSVEPFSDTVGTGDHGNRQNRIDQSATDADQQETGDLSDVDDDGDRGGEAGDDAGGPGTSLRALSCLEGEGGNEKDGARRGVQKRDFLKKRRFELSGLGGYYASDALSSTYVYGAALSFFPSEDFGVEVMVTRNPVAFRLEEAFTSFDRERRFEGGVAWNFLGAMLWSPVHAKLRWSERRITHADLLLIAGAGHTAHESVQGMTFQVGGAVKLYLTRFISLRVDVRDLMVPQEVLGRGRTTHNLITLFGLSFWVPG